MKRINQFITEYIIKKKLDKPIDSEDHYEYFPKTKKELIENIKELIKKGIYDFNCIDTSAIIDMSDLFDKINIDINFDVSRWDVSNVEDMNWLFSYCKNFMGNGLENWNTSKVKDMHNMFEKCISLKNKPSWYKK